jgi:hypothetical protein
MEKISWTDRVRNEDVLSTVMDERSILHTVKGRNANWIGPILGRNCLLKHVMEGKLEGTGRRGRRCEQLLDNRKEISGYWKLNEETTRSHSQRNSLFKRVYGPVVTLYVGDDDDSDGREYCCVNKISCSY